MKYIAIDLETTGLDPEKHQVIEIGMVADSLSSQFEYGSLHIIVQQPSLTFDPAALVMHTRSGLLREMVREVSSDAAVVESQYVSGMIREWLDEIGFLQKSHERLVVAGKNPSFDLGFIFANPHLFPFGRSQVHHRTLDPAILHLETGDMWPPDLETCCRRDGIPFSTTHIHTGLRAHRAVDDAWAIVHLIRNYFGQEPLYHSDEDE